MIWTPVKSPLEFKTPNPNMEKTKDFQKDASYIINLAKKNAVADTKSGKAKMIWTSTAQTRYPYKDSHYYYTITGKNPSFMQEQLIGKVAFTFCTTKPLAARKGDQILKTRHQSYGIKYKGTK